MTAARRLLEFLTKQAAIACGEIPLQFKEEWVMNKATSTLIAAIAALALSGGAYAQAAGGAGGGSSSNGSTASPSNQMNSTTNSYGTPGTNTWDSGAKSPNSGLP